MIGGRGNAQIIPAAHRVDGPLDVERLRRALAAVVDHHAALRTALVERDSVLSQWRMPSSEADFAVADLTSLPPDHRNAETQRLAQAFFGKPFRLDQGPMLRTCAVRLAPDAHLLLTAAHHSACDGWSMDLVNRDLSAAYADPAALGPQRPAPFTEYCRTTAGRDRRGEFERMAEAVLAALAGTPAQPWAGSADHGTAPSHLRFSLDLEVVQRVRIVAQSQATTPFHLYLAAYQLLLACAADRDAIVTGCAVANRYDPRYAETVGFFANIVPAPTRIDWSASVAAHLADAVLASTQALRYAEVPYGLLTRARPDLPGLFDTFFTLQPPPSHRLELPDCTVTQVEPAAWPLPYPLMLDVQEHAEGASVLLRFDGNAPMPVSAAWIAEAYPLFVTAMSALPEVSLRQLRDASRPLPRAANSVVRQRIQDLIRKEATDRA